MKKRILSLLLAMCLCIGLMSMAAIATDGEPQAATITAYEANSTTEKGPYATIVAAANAAGVGGRVVISEGVLTISNRQTISVANVTVEGAGRGETILVPAENFANASDKKALLTIAASGVTLKGMSVDGTSYGETIDMSDTTERDFVVLRINSGSGIILNDLYVTGSPKTLMQLGTGNILTGNSVSVTATNLYCVGMPKPIENCNVYPDIDILNRSVLTVNSGALHAFIAKEFLAGYTLSDTCEPMYTMRSGIYSLTTTFQHYANMYVAMYDDLSGRFSDYAEAAAISTNYTAIGNMVERAKVVASADPASVRNFIILLTDAKEYADSAYESTLERYITELNACLPGDGSD